MHKELNRDTADWRLRHACPACTYKLKDEKPLLYSLLFTMDGNDSLKRIHRREVDKEGNARASSEYADNRDVRGDFYLTREAVDAWANEAIHDVMAADMSAVSH